jgi:hypothetical protein
MTMGDKVRVSDWRDVRRAAIAAGGISEAGIAETQRELLDEVRAHRLDAMTVAQPRLSQFERGVL